MLPYIYYLLPLFAPTKAKVTGRFTIKTTNQDESQGGSDEQLVQQSQPSEPAQFTININSKESQRKVWRRRRKAKSSQRNNSAISKFWNKINISHPAKPWLYIALAVILGLLAPLMLVFGWLGILLCLFCLAGVCANVTHYKYYYGKSAKNTNTESSERCW